MATQVSGIVVPLLRFYFHEEVRIGAVQMLSELLRSSNVAAEKGVQGASKANVKQLLDYIWPALIEAVSKVCLSRHFAKPLVCLLLSKQERMFPFLRDTPPPPLV